MKKSRFTVEQIKAHEMNPSGMAELVQISLPFQVSRALPSSVDFVRRSRASEVAIPHHEWPG